MTESGLLLLNFIFNNCNPEKEEREKIIVFLSDLTNWLYSSSGFYNKNVSGTKDNFDSSVWNKNFYRFINDLAVSIYECNTVQLVFWDGFVTSLFKKYKQQFIDKYKITNINNDDNNIYSNNISIFHFSIENIFNCIKNKKVLVISSFGKLIKKQYDSGNINKIYDNFPIIEKLITFQFPYCFLNSGPHNNYYETLESVFQEIKNIDFDIVLLGCGAYAPLLSHKIDIELKKDSICLGGKITTLFGILSKRDKKNEIIFNEHWITEIPDEFKPENYKAIEGGCYW